MDYRSQEQPRGTTSEEVSAAPAPKSSCSSEESSSVGVLDDLAQTGMSRGLDRVSAYTAAVLEHRDEVVYTEKVRCALARRIADQALRSDSDAPMSMEDVLERLPPSRDGIARVETTRSAHMFFARALRIAEWALGSRVTRDVPESFPPVRSRNRGRGKLSRSVIGEYWRGEYSLPMSFWGFGLMLVFPCAQLATGLASFAMLDGAFWRQVIAVPSLWMFLFSLTLWHCVGLTRSALRHMARTGRKVAGVLAQLWVAVWALKSAPQFLDALPICVELVRQPGAFSVRGTPDDQIEVLGALSFGVSSQVEKTLAAHPATRMIYLNSPGGRVSEGQRLRELIREHHLDTITTEACESACILAFSGGKRRFLGPGAILGFHQPRFQVSGLPDSLIAAEVESEVQLLVESGMEEATVRRGLATSGAEVFRPPVADLLEARVITDALPVRTQRDAKPTR